MRLICPNCDAQYEVPDEVVPTEGRDVQCSNCGQTWFQHHPDHAPEEDDSGVDVDAPAPDEEISPPPPPAPAQEEPERKQLDPAVADILRQEAEAEHEARRNRQSEPLESQPDLGLDGHDDQDGSGSDRRAREARERMARMRGEPEQVSDAAVNAAAISSRRDLLPDIEEINSTLRTDSKRTGANASDNTPHIEAPTSKKRKRNFQVVLMMLVLFAILAVLYVYAPQIAKAVPQVDPYLNSYVTWVDQMRLWLDGNIQNLLTWLDSMATKSDG